MKSRLTHRVSATLITGLAAAALATGAATAAPVTLEPATPTADTHDTTTSGNSIPVAVPIDVSASNGSVAF
ncbi:hypothetical protein [Nocardia sp. NPDC005825]|uniref:hypothetical protein n=1 Tax=unclassified Nocardia TaxID=2637762 RepID=UPI0033FDC64C